MTHGWDIPSMILGAAGGVAVGLGLFGLVLWRIWRSTRTDRWPLFALVGAAYLAAIWLSVGAGCSVPVQGPVVQIASATQPAVAPGAVSPGAADIDVAPGAVDVDVQFGPASQPAGQPVIAATATVQRGAVAPGAVQAVGYQAAPSGPASQPAEAVSGPRTAGRDVSDRTLIVNASGSAWPIVACVAAVVAGLVALGWLRTAGKAKRLRGNALAVARAIAAQAPAEAAPDGGVMFLPRRKGVADGVKPVLGMIEKTLPHRADWDRLLDADGCRVRRKA
ncbi:MAG: hypothetical protein WC789_13845 [Lentisphaeria bacterium]